MSRVGDLKVMKMNKRLQELSIIHPLIDKKFLAKIDNKEADAKRREIKFDLSDAEILKLIIDKCYYCGYEDKIHGIGIDRVDNEIGYFASNCVPCCKICNKAKGTLSIKDFKNWLMKVTSFINTAKSE